MAVWQFPLALVPKQHISDPTEFLPEPFLCEDGWEFATLWKGVHSTIAIQQLIDTYLPRAASWSIDLSIWEKEGNDIQVGHIGNEIEDVIVRLDLRQPVRSFTKSVVDIAVSLDCYLMAMGGSVLFEATIENVEEQSRQSRAYQFVNAGRRDIV